LTLFIPVRALNFTNHPLLAQNFVVSTLSLFCLRDENKLNCWVLHPVARVSTNAFLKTTVRNNVFVPILLWF
jgi:hypothetical protein